MFEIKFKYNTFEFFAEITDMGIYSFRIERIQPHIYNRTIINSPHIESITIRRHLDRLIEEITSYIQNSKYKIKVNTDFTGYSEREIKIYKALMEVPSGSVTTYGILAKHVFGNKANRYIGRALSHNRLQIIVPCHRVVMKDLKIGGFTNPMGVKLKILLLKNEGIKVNNCKIEHCRIYEF
ncbi:MAG: MGMT family protein [Myxococcota bacterium]